VQHWFGAGGRGVRCGDGCGGRGVGWGALLQAAVELLKGPAGSRVRLAVMRRDDGLAIHARSHKTAVMYNAWLGLVGPFAYEWASLSASMRKFMPHVQKSRHLHAPALPRLFYLIANLLPFACVCMLVGETCTVVSGTLLCQRNPHHKVSSCDRMD
jgi:hypothetical protein